MAFSLFGDSGAGSDLKKYFNMARKDLEPYRNLGPWAIPQIKDLDVTGGAGNILDALKSDSFKFNPDDPSYQFRLGEAQEGVDKFLSSRGLYNSRAGLNALLKERNRLSSEEVDRQYGRQVDMFNMSRMLGSDRFNKLFNLLNVGSGAAGASANAALQTGGNMATVSMQNAANRMSFISDLLGLGTGAGLAAWKL